MTWSESKRKKIWGRKANPAVVMGVLIIAYSAIGGGVVALLLGLVVLVIGLRYYGKYKKK